MERQEVDFTYLVSQGLHDAEINTFAINYTEKTVILEISTNSDAISIKLKDIRLLKINMADDFVNKEIILDFSYDEGHKKINLFTTSNSRYEFSFKSSQIFINTD